MTPQTFYFSFLCAFLCICFSVNAQEIINQQDWITRNQQYKIEQFERQNELDSFQKKRKLQVKEKQKSRVLDQQIQAIGKCFQIQQIELIGATKIVSMQRQNLIKDYIGQCFDGQILSDLVKKVTNFYQDRGYVSTQILVPKQNINAGILQLKILEGKISKIIFDGDGYGATLKKITAFGHIEGDILDLDDINQGVYQINRLSSNNAIVKIQPADAVGYSNIMIENNTTSPMSLDISYDNSGNEFTGVRKTGLNFAYDNLLSLNDNIHLSLSQNLDDDNKEKDLKSFSAAISVPYREYTLSYSFFRSDYLGTIENLNSKSKLTGYSTQQSTTIDRLLLAKGNHRLMAHLNLTTKKSASYVEYDKQENSQRKLTIANFALSLSSYFDNGVTLYVKPSISKGLKILNAKQDEIGSNADIPRSQYQAFKLYVSISKNMVIPKLQIPVVISSEMSGQVSQHVLFGSEQFSVGGYYSVRGSRENYVTGDHGYYLRNQARFNLAQVAMAFVQKDDNVKWLTHLSKMTFEPFYDYGQTQNSAFQGHGKMGALGFKTSYRSKNITASLTHGWIVQNSVAARLSSPTRENKMIFFELKCGI